MKIYLVGGAVRDKLLGIESKDLDYVMVFQHKNWADGVPLDPIDGFDIMRDWMEKKGFEIFLETPEMFTIRARFPKDHKNAGTTADFVLARKEVGYVEGTRRPILELGDLSDDLARRDFTINAMAEDDEGNLIDLFGGEKDLKNGVLRTPLDPDVTFADDPLRVLRAFRFALTKGMQMSFAVRDAMRNPFILKKMKEVVSQERVREEISKMMKHNTKKAVKLLVEAENNFCPGILDICFGEDIWLKPTTEKR